jgi:hypothetical protein
MSSEKIDWSTKVDTEVKLTGIAQNAKAGPVLMTGPEEAILVQRLAQWDEKHVGKKVAIRAILRRVQGYPKAKRVAGQTTQGTASGADTFALELKDYRVLD